MKKIGLLSLFLCLFLVGCSSEVQNDMEMKEKCLSYMADENIMEYYFTSTPHNIYYSKYHDSCLARYVDLGGFYYIEDIFTHDRVFYCDDEFYPSSSLSYDFGDIPLDIEENPSCSSLESDFVKYTSTHFSQ